MCVAYALHWQVCRIEQSRTQSLGAHLVKENACGVHFLENLFFSRVSHPAVLSVAVLTPGSGQGQGPKGKGWPSLLISFWSRFFPGLLQGRDGKKRKGNGRKWKRREERKGREGQSKSLETICSTAKETRETHRQQGKKELNLSDLQVWRSKADAAFTWWNASKGQLRYDLLKWRCHARKRFREALGWL